ncbi:MAG: HlyD family secretion protein [Acidobacteriales bacterium]|nr:HlyD family secretion protein [Terriglobales bacterium]
MNDIVDSVKEERSPAVTAGTRRRMRAVVIAGGVLAAVAGTWYYLDSRSYESTDNAFIEGNIVQVSPRVSGQVIRVLVTDNQHVNRGDLIAEIDPRDYETRLAEARATLQDASARISGAESNLNLTSTTTRAVLTQAEAALAAARDQVAVLEARLAQGAAGVRVAEAGLQQAEARQAVAEAENLRAANDVVRYRALYQKDEVSRQMLDRAETDARSSTANLEAAKQVVASARAQLSQANAGHAASLAALGLANKQVRQAEGRLHEAQSAPQQLRVRHSDLQSAKAQQEQQGAAVKQAELNLSYTKIYAPDSGYITKKSVEPGNFVQAGQALLAIVSDRLWVVANFKETQLTHMRPGQWAEIKVDAYPQMKLRGRVDSIQSGTGARFSLIPPENATGNYVKVVQRVPVKIVLLEPPSAGFRVGPGMSVEPKVRVR